MNFVIHVSVLVPSEAGILFVREGKPANYGKWNLPGGHLELGEQLTAGARREVREETGLDVSIEGLVGIYTSMRADHCMRYVFVGQPQGGTLCPQAEEILQCRWFRPQELASLPDESLLGPAMLREILADHQTRPAIPSRIISESMQTRPPA